MQPGRRVQALAIPAQKTADGEAVTEAVQPRWRDPGRHRQIEREHQLVERSAGAVRVHAAPAIEGEQRRLVAERPGAAAAIELLLEQRTDRRPVRDETTLPELAAPDGQQATVLIDVAEAQTARLAGAQPEPVAEREDRPVGRCPPSGAGVVGQRVGRLAADVAPAPGRRCMGLAGR